MLSKLEDHLQILRGDVWEHLAALWLLCATVADVRLLLQHLKSPVKSADGFYCSFYRVFSSFPSRLSCCESSNCTCVYWGANDAWNPHDRARACAPEDLWTKGRASLVPEPFFGSREKRRNPTCSRMSFQTEFWGFQSVGFTDSLCFQEPLIWSWGWGKRSWPSADPWNGSRKHLVMWRFAF